MAVSLEQRHAQPFCWSQPLASQLPIQSFQAQLGTQAYEEAAKRAAATAEDFIVTDEKY